MAAGVEEAAANRMGGQPASAPLLDIQDLTITFPSRRGEVVMLDRVSFEVCENEIVGLVGESGSGKTLTSLAVMRFLPPSARIVAGRLCYQGQNLLEQSAEAMRHIRGEQIAMIFQSPRSALNPLMPVGTQVARVYQLHLQLDRRAAYEAGVQMLKRVGIADAERCARAYPHQLSGGMAQRVLVAMMVACRPRLLIADEPTTGLDVTIQAQIFELLRDIQAETKASILLITHDLGVVAETCRRVVVMYAGQIMEIAESKAIFAAPQHPYTERLLSSVLRVDRLIQPPKMNFPQTEAELYAAQGCRFAERCAEAQAVCRQAPPPRIEKEPGHLVMCHKYGKQFAAAPQG